VIGVDIKPDALELARAVGAQVALDARTEPDLIAAIHNLTDGGAHVSLDALGSTTTCRNSILSLRKRGRHVQVGLMVAGDQEPPIPMGPVIAKELEILGSHGMQAHAYPPLLDMITSGKLDLTSMIGKRIALEGAITALPAMGDFQGTGITIIDRF
jgi:alcohol dehydrogenase